MPVMICEDDPALGLWTRADSADLEKFWDIFETVPIRVGLIAERLNIAVISLTLETDISGLIRKNEEGKFEIQVNNTDAPVRQRFTVCHEIAHYLLHRHLIDSEGITDNILYRSKLSSRQETEANRLGAAILLPWPKVTEWHQAKFGGPPHKSNIEQIANAFRASSLAVGLRLGI